MQVMRRRLHPRRFLPGDCLDSYDVAAFSSVSAREWALDGAMIGPPQARCSSVAANMNRSTSAWVSWLGCLRLDMAISGGLRIAALGHYSSQYGLQRQGLGLSPLPAGQHGVKSCFQFVNGARPISE
jgi:hypothetical protein